MYDRIFRRPETRRNLFDNFVRNVLPKLIEIVTRFELKDRVDHRQLADGTVFSYCQALLRSRRTMGEWSKEIEGETIFHLYLNCFINGHEQLPRKSEDQELANFQKVIYSGALDQLVSFAAARPIYARTRFRKVIEKKQPLLQAADLFDINVLRSAEEVRLRFK